MKITLPNALTLLRIALIPVLFAVFWLPFNWIKPLCGMIFTLAAITDWFDGYLARKLNQNSTFGAFLDPVADKLMVVTALILIVVHHPSIWMVIPVSIIIGREIVISALREWMAEVGKRATVKVSALGKVKTTFQMFAIGFLLWEYDIWFIPTYAIGYALLQIAAALTLLSMLIYLRAAWPHITAEDVD
ncbi:MAG: CDP-diacylglycerol--glycerol-3-phosphate 3-phosphatidyltransferase [Gammaproteobacteria bacterium]|nr:CDP-diacylglycerol--glycerol-3-phosphate 3-phosphatidyltransferase [Gammaproteobacteria bacterium]